VCVHAHCGISSEKVHRGVTLKTSEVSKSQFLSLPLGFAAIFTKNVTILF
jgi:hypothetical protein